MLLCVLIFEKTDSWLSLSSSLSNDSNNSVNQLANWDSTGTADAAEKLYKNQNIEKMRLTSWKMKLWKSFCLIKIDSYSWFKSKILKFFILGKKTALTASDSNNSTSKQRSKQKLLQTESSDFKLVFISSDSSKDSDQLNSSLEGPVSTEPESNNNNEFIHNADMEYEEDVLRQQSPPQLPPKVR